MSKSFEEWFATKHYSQNPTSIVRGVAREAYNAALERAAEIAENTPHSIFLVNGKGVSSRIAAAIRKEMNK